MFGDRRSETISFEGWNVLNASLSFIVTEQSLAHHDLLPATVGYTVVCDTSRVSVELDESSSSTIFSFDIRALASAVLIAMIRTKKKNPPTMLNTNIV